MDKLNFAFNDKRNPKVIIFLLDYGVHFLYARTYFLPDAVLSEDLLFNTTNVTLTYDKRKISTVS